VLLHGGLFVACCITTTWVGGIAFGATLMGILTCHELGHYVVGRRHGVDVSLPYFIPLPYLTWGTLGAVIEMREPISRRNALIDVGAAGPIAGLVVAVPLLIWGLWMSPVGVPELVPGQPSVTEGNSLLYLGLKYLVHGQWLPSGRVDVQLSSMAMAAWVGILLTFINLLPIGQLDGGHIATAFFGERQERLAAFLHKALPVMAFAVFTGLFFAARQHGLAVFAATKHGASSALPWLVWAALLLFMRRGGGGRYHPPVDPEPLSPGRRGFFVFMVIVFFLVFTPVPMRETLP
jgi:uncharacterized protein (TIGR03382 family)